MLLFYSGLALESVLLKHWGTLRHSEGSKCYHLVHVTGKKEKNGPFLDIIVHHVQEKAFSWS